MVIRLYICVYAYFSQVPPFFRFKVNIVTFFGHICQPNVRHTIYHINMVVEYTTYTASRWQKLGKNYITTS